MCGCVSEQDMQRYEIKAVSFYNIVRLSVSGIRCWAVLAPEYLNNSAKRQRNENNTKNPIEIMKPETDQRVRREEEKVGEQTVQE